ncbi:MAG: ammonium transporter [Caulobacter sp.]|nr:ammonium transporter [Caulobacter sp.]
MMIKRLLPALALAAAFLAGAAALRFGESQGLWSGELARRVLQVMIGLGLAAYANLMPKQLSTPRRSPAAEARVQKALRIGGWSLTLAGLAHAALWAFAPLAIANLGSMIAVATGMAVTAGYAAFCLVRARRSGT